MIRVLPAQQGESTSRHEPAISSMLPEGDITADILHWKTTGVSAQDRETISSGKVNFSIASDGREYRFWADGKLSLLESITIDRGKNWVKLGDHQLEYAGIASSHDDDGLPNNWRGYRWSAEIATHADCLSSEKETPTKRYTVTLGLLRITGQTFLHIQSEAIENGEWKTQFDLPLLF